MPRYIDADALIFEEKLLKDHKILGMNGTMVFGRTDSKTLQMFASAFKQMIDKAPTADVVPRSEYDAVVNAVDNSTKEFLKLHDAFQQAKQEVARELIDDIADFIWQCRGESFCLLVDGTFYGKEELKEFLRKKYIGE